MFNVPGLIEHLIESIKLDTGHKISWLNSSELQKYKRILPQVTLASDINTSLDAKLYVTGVGGRKLTYENKKLVKGYYNGIEMAITYLKMKKNIDYISRPAASLAVTI